MAGEVQHFEIPYEKADRAKRFYGTVFGWKMNEMPQMDYTMVMTGPSDAQGMPTKTSMVNGGMMKRNSAVKAPTVTITVDDIEKALEQVKQEGGKVVTKKQPVGDMGWTAYIKDTEGNVIGLWQRSGKGPM
jgi:predicted enzyme related to lactoylglutathione lyase